MSTKFRGTQYCCVEITNYSAVTLKNLFRHYSQRISSEIPNIVKNVASSICWSPVTWCLHKSCRLIILIHQPFYTTGLGSAPQSGPWLAAWHHINPDRWYCDTCDLYSRRVARHSSKSPSLSLPGCRQRIFVAWILKCVQLGAEQRLVLARWSGQPALQSLNRSLNYNLKIMSRVDISNSKYSNIYISRYLLLCMQAVPRCAGQVAQDGVSSSCRTRAC